MGRSAAPRGRLAGLHGGTPQFVLTTVDAQRRARRKTKNREIAAAERVAGAYFKDLNRLVRDLYRDIDDLIVSKIPRWTREEAALQSEDAMDDELPALIEQLKRKYVQPQILFAYQGAARDAEERIKRQNKLAVERQLSTLGIDIFREPGFRVASNRFVRRNTALITSIPQQSLTSVEQTIERGVQSGMRASELAQQIMRIAPPKDGSPSELRKARNRAALIARDQTLTHSAQLSRSRQRANGITKFVWRTVGDGRVRDLHEDRDGKEYTWKDGAGSKDKYPGDGVNCRCSAEPVL